MDGFRRGHRLWLRRAVVLARTGDERWQAREAHIAFAAADRAAIQAFHDAAVAHGAEVLHAPKEWPECHVGYGAFVRDPDGNSVEAMCRR